MQQIKNMTSDEIKARFIELTLMHTKESLNCARKANAAYTKLIKIHKLMETDEVDKSILLELIDHTDPAVRVTAAAHLLALNLETDKALDILDSIAERKFDEIYLRVACGDAKMTAKVYREQGYLRLYS